MEAAMAKEGCIPYINTSGAEVEPHTNDVLLGKGPTINNHVGNRKFRQLIQSHHVKYDNSKEGSKHLVAKDIVDSLYSEGCRFLKKTDKGAWEEVTKKRAYTKAQQSLREGAPKRKSTKYQLKNVQPKQEKHQRESRNAFQQPDSLNETRDPGETTLFVNELEEFVLEHDPEFGDLLREWQEGS